jgi:hypothetical protein
MVRTPEWKLIEYPEAGRTQLFRLEDDPNELVDQLAPWRFRPTKWYTPKSVGRAIREVADRLKGELAAWKEANDDAIPSRAGARGRPSLIGGAPTRRSGSGRIL